MIALISAVRRDKWTKRRPKAFVCRVFEGESPHFHLRRFSGPCSMFLFHPNNLYRVLMNNPPSLLSRANGHEHTVFVKCWCFEYQLKFGFFCPHICVNLFSYRAVLFPSCWKCFIFSPPLTVIPPGRLLLHSDGGVRHQVDDASLRPHAQTDWYTVPSFLVLRPPSISALSRPLTACARRPSLLKGHDFIH